MNTEETKKYTETGMLNGMFFSAIPFYRYIKFFGEIGNVRKESKAKGFLITSLALRLGFVLVTLIGTLVMIGNLVQLFQMADVRSISEDYAAQLVFYFVMLCYSLLLLSAIMSIVSMIFGIMGGLRYKKFLEKEGTFHFKEEELYEQAKLIGTFTSLIPAYTFIQGIIVREEDRTQSKTLILVTSILSLFGGLVYLILAIVTGKNLKESALRMVEKPVNVAQNYNQPIDISRKSVASEGGFVEREDYSTNASSQDKPVTQAEGVSMETTDKEEDLKSQEETVEQEEISEQEETSKQEETV